jgi:hypothetical protein
VVPLQVHPLPLELLEMPRHHREAEAREGDELVDEVGLVEVATVGRQPTPRRRSGLLDDRQQALQALYPLKSLGRQTDLGLEDLDEPPVAEPHARRHLTDGRGAGSGVCLAQLLGCLARGQAASDEEVLCGPHESLDSPSASC